MMRTAIVCLALAFDAGAQSPSAPIAGNVLNPNGALISVTGVLGTLMPGVPIPLASDPIRSAAFSATGGVIKTDAEVILTDGSGAVLSRASASAGTAIWGFGADGAAQWMYVPGSKEILNLNGGSPIGTSMLGGELIALGTTGTGGLPALARTGSQLWAEVIDPASGTVAQQMPVAGTTPAIAFEEGWLVTTTTGLQWIAPSSAAPTAISSPAPVVSLQTAGSHSVAVNGRWLLNRAWQLLEIPAFAISPPRSTIAPPRREGR